MRFSRLVLIAGLAAAASGCAYDSYGQGYGYGYPAYGGGAYGRDGVGGTGARDLDPWLSGTAIGRRLVLARFDRNYNGEIGPDRAAEANAWFRRFADANNDMDLTDREIRHGLARLERGLGG